jgi:hypothetical protein
MDTLTVDSVLEMLATVTIPPDSLRIEIENIRREMEIPQGGYRSFPSDNKASSWRGSSQLPRPATHAPTPKVPHARYQSQFKASGDIDGKILNTIIGNKLNSFTQLTYNDTRDFIYQIMDSGEKEFIKHFVDKVFTKATDEELYCALFAKLIAEIAHRYPIMYEEMDIYHAKFLQIFEDVEDHRDCEYDVQVKKRQYRMGYGHFISELAGQNALPKERLNEMMDTLGKRLVLHADDPGKTKTLEEYTDCLVRVVKNLKEKSPAFFLNVHPELHPIVSSFVTPLLAEKKLGFSTKARFALMDLRDLFV